MKSMARHPETLVLFVIVPELEQELLALEPAAPAASVPASRQALGLWFADGVTG